MDEDLLRALGYSDLAIKRREVWEKKVTEYFKDKDFKSQLESYCQVDFQKRLIVFRDDCPQSIATDLQKIFDDLDT